MTLQETKEFTTWVVRNLLKNFVVGIIVLTAYQTFLVPTDTTDGEWPNRSGMRPLTDAQTGCQYLMVPGGGVTPRISSEGNHMGCRRQP
jgi:hypothetical protein